MLKRVGFFCSFWLLLAVAVAVVAIAVVVAAAVAFVVDVVPAAVVAAFAVMPTKIKKPRFIKVRKRGSKDQNIE